MAAQTLSAQTLAAVQDAFLADPETLSLSRDRKSGGEWADLRKRMHTADPRCAVCGLVTIITAARQPNAARHLVLIPCALTDDNGGRDRMGYVPGNLALACWACVSEANNYGTATGEAVVFTADCLTLPETVWLAWPALGKRKALATDHSADARTARQRLGLPF